MTNQAALASLTSAVSPSASHHSGGGHPVIAGDEFPDSDRRVADPLHACDRLSGRHGVRKSRASRREKARTAGRGRAGRHPRRASSAPAPSAPQKIPNEVSITPTLNFMAFSGALASGWRTATPIAATSTTAAAAASGRRPTRCWFAPKVSAMKTTSRPSSRTPLKAIVNE